MCSDKFLSNFPCAKHNCMHCAGILLEAQQICCAPACPCVTVKASDITFDYGAEHPPHLYVNETSLITAKLGMTRAVMVSGWPGVACTPASSILQSKVCRALQDGHHNVSTGKPVNPLHALSTQT
jgi:hypothetical protein